MTAVGETRRQKREGKPAGRLKSSESRFLHVQVCGKPGMRRRRRGRRLSTLQECACVCVWSASHMCQRRLEIRVQPWRETGGGNRGRNKRAMNTTTQEKKGLKGFFHLAIMSSQQTLKVVKQDVKVPEKRTASSRGNWQVGKRETRRDVRLLMARRRHDIVANDG